MFGLQGLSSAETEVRALVHALVPKILACRDELSAEQICHALYGLQNLSSEHEEVRLLLFLPAYHFLVEPPSPSAMQPMLQWYTPSLAAPDPYLPSSSPSGTPSLRGFDREAHAVYGDHIYPRLGLCYVRSTGDGDQFPRDQANDRSDEH
jgi:hypothetical protein